MFTQRTCKFFKFSFSRQNLKFRNKYFSQRRKLYVIHLFCLGKINSLFGVCEALMPLVYGPMYSATYKATIEVMPGAFFLLGGLLTLPACLIFG